VSLSLRIFISIGFPIGENLIAFESKLSRIWIIRVLSVLNSASSSSLLKLITISFLFADSIFCFIRVSIIPFADATSYFMFTLPSSILFISSKLVIISNILSEDYTIVPANSSKSSLVSSSSCWIISPNPFIATNGFFRSCAAIPRNSFFSLFNSST
jgi:hypothetical protein